LEKIKERDYMFDTFRGLLILSIPISHFTKMAGNLYGDLYMDGSFPQQTLFGFIYITINVFVMQAFMFLSGYFSKNVDRAQQSAFTTFMWPYLVFTVLYYFVRLWLFGDANLKLLTPPFALWFLFVLFFYRFFLKYMVKFQYLLPLSFMLCLIVGQFEEFGNFMSLGRALSYFPFFLLGYYCSKERLKWFQKLKEKPIILILLATVLVAASLIIINCTTNTGWFLLKQSYHNYPITWWQDILLRMIVCCLASGWIILMINIIPSKKNFISFIGMNTMPIYVFHLTIRYIIQIYGLYVGFISCLIVAWFGIISIIYIKNKNRIKYGTYILTILISIIIITMFYLSGCLESLYGLCPENILYTYLLTYGGAIICGISFVSPFWIKLYNLLINGLGQSKLAEWLRKEC